MKKLLPLYILMYSLSMNAQDCIVNPTFTIDELNDDCDFIIELCADIVESGVKLIEFNLSYDSNGDGVDDMITQTMSDPAGIDLSMGQSCANFFVTDMDCASTFSTFTRSYTDVVCGDEHMCGRLGPFLFPESTLPVETISFTAKADNEVNLIQLITANESNTSMHLLERSEDGKEDFRIVTQFEAAGNTNSSSTYSFSDDELSPLAYYRIRTIDFDGTNHISTNVVVVDRTHEYGDDATIYPVPAIDKVSVIFDTYDDRPVNLYVTNLMGQIVLRQQYTLAPGKQFQELDISDLKNNIYLLYIDNGRKKVARKIVKTDLK